MRVHSDERGSSPALSKGRSSSKHRQQSRHEDQNSAKQTDEAGQLIVEAEQFKASVEKPKGNSPLLVPQVTAEIASGFPLHNLSELTELNEYIKRVMDNDDDEFFHLTCHIDANLKFKIELGQFVELEHLLPRSHSQVVNDEQKFQMVNKNSYSDIGNRHFVCMPQFTAKLIPHRSAEIWQYIHVINSASSAYVWENVVYYDVTFRQLMSQKPGRSWAKIYGQLWNLAMCEPLTRQSQNNDKFKHGNSSSNSGKQGNWRDRCCWCFNRGNKCKKVELSL